MHGAELFKLVLISQRAVSHILKLTLLCNRIAYEAPFVLVEVEDTLGRTARGVPKRIAVAPIERSLEGTIVPAVVEVCQRSKAVRSGSRRWQ
jgi:hypothetical protein